MGVIFIMVDYHSSNAQNIVGDIGRSLEKLVNIQWLIIGTAIINFFVSFTGTFLKSPVLLALIFSILVFFSPALIVLFQQALT